MSINLVMVDGALSKDVEVKTAKSGTKWGTLSLAHSVAHKKDQVVTYKTMWLTVSVFGKTAERLDGLGKGSRILVEGTLNQEEWNDKETGKKRTQLKVNANRVTITEKKLAETSIEKETRQMDQEVHEIVSNPAYSASDIPF